MNEQVSACFPALTGKSEAGWELYLVRGERDKKTANKDQLITLYFHHVKGQQRHK